MSDLFLRTENPADQPNLKQRLLSEQLDTHYRQLPAVIIAPALGDLFTAWVLWDAVILIYLQIGLVAVLSISGIRILIYRWYFSLSIKRNRMRMWQFLSIGTALTSGCIWSSAVFLLYPPIQPDYQIYMLVLFALVPVAPVAALAVYMPAFYAYYIPCITPFLHKPVDPLKFRLSIDVLRGASEI